MKNGFGLVYRAETHSPFSSYRYRHACRVDPNEQHGENNLLEPKWNQSEFNILERTIEPNKTYATLLDLNNYP